MIELELDLGDPAPPFQQIRDQLMAAVVGGRLAAGERLPTVRQLANDLGLAANTVARAYRELDALGVIVGQGRRGTVVAPGATALVASSAAPASMTGHANALARVAIDAGQGEREAIAAVLAAFERERRVGG